jgi:hypothetical protein
MVRFWQVRNRDKRWFDGIKDIWKHLGKYEYFGTFHFGRDEELSFDDASKIISHFRNVITRKMFGNKGSFDMNFLSVIEDVKWNKKTGRYEPVKTHFHFLISDPPEYARMDMDFCEFLIESWCSLRGTDVKEEQQVIPIYHTNKKVVKGVVVKQPLVEEYITKLRLGKWGIRWEDKENSTLSLPTPFDEDGLDYISSLIEDVKGKPDKYH